MTSPENDAPNMEQFEHLLVNGGVIKPANAVDSMNVDLPYETHIHQWIDDIRDSVYQRFDEYQSPPAKIVGSLYYSYTFEDEEYSKRLFEDGVGYLGEPERRIIIRSYSSDNDEVDIQGFYPDLKITLNDRRRMQDKDSKPVLAILSKNLLISGYMDEIHYSESAGLFSEEDGRQLELDNTSFAVNKTKRGLRQSRMHIIGGLVDQPEIISGDVWFDAKTDDDRRFVQIISQNEAQSDPADQLAVADQILEETSNLTPNSVSSEDLS